MATRCTLVGAAIIVSAAIYTIWRERQRRSELVRSPEGATCRTDPESAARQWVVCRGWGWR
ncbi:hypothetical protein [Oricola sp.]|uniref:hypothetical protein n=1 Tax=Oricola sp. TaxID=1979950 RepID=UPI003BA87084